MIKVSVIIPTYNRKRVLEKVLEHLFFQNYPRDKYEVMVVDDGSTDGTEAMVKSKDEGHPQLRYFYQERRGPHIARNLGIKNARGEIIIFVDSDILTPPGFIKEHMKFHRRFENIIVSGPAVRTHKLNETFEDIESRKFKKFFDLSGPSLITSNLSLKRKFLIKVGMFDEEFEGLGWHDWELGLRLKRFGLRAKRNLNAIVYHYKKKRAISDLSSLCGISRKRGRNAVLYYKKHPSLKVKLGIRTHSLLLDKFLWWLDRDLGKKLLSFADRKNNKFLLNLLIEWRLIKAYAQGLREGMRKHKVRLSRWM